MKNYVIYRGELIAKNSDAYKLWEDNKWKELDKHLAALDRKAKELQEKY